MNDATYNEAWAERQMDKAVIAKNRRRFFQVHAIECVDRRRTICALLAILRDAYHGDHREAFRCRDGSVILTFSTYPKYPSPTLDEVGFEKTDAIYHVNAQSWMRRMESFVACRQWRSRLRKEIRERKLAR